MTSRADSAPGVLPTPAQPDRLLRATAAGGSSACLGLAAHTAAGGDPPHAVVVAVAAALLVRLAYGLCGRRRGVATTVAALTGSQIALHIVFVLASHPADGQHRHVLAPAELLVERDGICGGAMPAVTMTAMHLLAVMLTALLLDRAERVYWAARAARAQLPGAITRLVGPPAAAAARLRRLLAARAAELLGAAAPAPGRPSTTICVPRPRGLPVGSAARRRGPPTAPSRRPVRAA